MKKIAIFIILGVVVIPSVSAQISMKTLEDFMVGFKIADTSGPGLTQASGDIFLVLSSDEQDVNEKMILIRNIKGKLSKIAENDDLLMNQSLLGISGSNYPSFFNNTIFVDYTLGSNSATSDVSIQFDKSIDGNYYFTEYTSKTQNYGVENLFARVKITNSQTGALNFSETTENLIWDKSKTHSKDKADEPLYIASERYAKYIPDDWRLATFSEGNLNQDDLSKDLLLVLYNGEECKIQLLMEEKDGSYKPSFDNNLLIPADETFNINNLKAVLKNGYFTIEQRIATDGTDFDHRYITFKYDPQAKKYFLYRYDVEHFSGFNPKPSPNVTHLTKADFGAVSFQDLDYAPGDYFYEPAPATIAGTLVEKQFYGRPNYGKTPETDEKVNVYVLKTDYPVNVFAGVDQADSETANITVRDISEIQVFSTDNKIDLSSFLNKKVILSGTLMPQQTGGQFTKVLLQVNFVDTIK